MWILLLGLSEFDSFRTKTPAYKLKVSGKEMDLLIYSVVIGLQLGGRVDFTLS